MKPDMFSKLGPLPTWAWAAGIIGAYLLWQHGKTTAATGTAVDSNTLLPDNNSQLLPGAATPSIDPSQAGYNYNDVLGGTYEGAVGGGGGGILQTATGTSYNFGTNEQWGNYAINQLSAAGTAGSDATNAIAHYLAGDPLSPSEVAIVNNAIQKFGAPPLFLPLNSQPTSPTPISTPTPAPMPTSAQAPDAAQRQFYTEFGVSPGSITLGGDLNPDNQLQDAVRLAPQTQTVQGQQYNTLSYINRFGVVVNTLDTPANRANLAAEGDRVLTPLPNG